MIMVFFALVYLVGFHKFENIPALIVTTASVLYLIALTS